MGSSIIVANNGSSDGDTAGMWLAIRWYDGVSLGTVLGFDDDGRYIDGDLVGMILGWFDWVLLGIIFGYNARSSNGDKVCMWWALRWYVEVKLVGIH